MQESQPNQKTKWDCTREVHYGNSQPVSTTSTITQHPERDKEEEHNRYENYSEQQISQKMNDNNKDEEKNGQKQ